MNYKQYIYEFIGFALFYGIVALIFGSESKIVCIIAGIIGAFAGKFISKVNGFFIDEVIDHHITNEGEGKVNVKFTLKANYKINPIMLFGSYTAIDLIDTKTLSVLLYNKFNDSHYKNILKQGTSTIKIELKEGEVEIKMRN
jgi:hypothetical protein